MLAPHIGDVVEKMTTLAGSAAKPAEYRKRVLNRLIPTILPTNWIPGRRCADPGEASEARRVPALQRAQYGHLTRYGVPTTWLAGLARLPSGPT
jgi:hypothetical protein